MIKNIINIYIYIISTIITQFKYLNVFTEILFFIVTWYFLDNFNLGKKKLPWWANITFFIYVAHSFILESLEKVFLIFFGKRTIFALIDFLIIPLVTLIIIIIIAKILIKFLPKTWKIITGDR